MAFKQKGFDAGIGTGMKSSPNMAGKKMNSPLDKPLVGNQKNLPPHLKAKIEAAPLRRLNIGGKEYGENNSPVKVTKFIAGKVLKPALGKLDDAWKYMTKSKPKVTTKKTNPPKTNTNKKNEVSTNVNKNIGPKNNKGPAFDNAKFQKEVLSKLPANTPKSKLRRAFNLFLGGANAAFVIDFVMDAVSGGGDDDKGGNDQAIQDAVDGSAAEATGKAAAEAAKKLKDKKNPYADAKKNDPNLDKHIAERNKHKKGTPEYDAAQNRINKAYGDRTRHGVTKSKGTKGRDTVSRLNVPGIVDKAKLERKRKIGGTKVIQQNVNLQTGEHKEKKTKGDKSKERFYDAEGNLTRKTKDKKNKQKDVIKTDNTVTKVKVNKRTGKVKTKTRRRRGQKTGEFFKSLVGK